jgi:hypothetical protein
MHSAHNPLRLPPLHTLVLAAVPRLVETLLIPTVLFVLLLHFAGIWFAIAGGFVWSTMVLSVRRLRGQPVPALVIVGLGFLLLRTVVAFATHSSFLYFIQPALGTASVGVVFLVSALVGRPLVFRLAQDFCPLPHDTMQHHHLRRLFLGLSALWGITLLLNAALTLWLLISQSVATYVVTRAATSYTLTLAAIAVSVLWFRHATRSHTVTTPRA